MFQIEFENNGKVVGIDLGTTNSLVAVMGATNRPEVIVGDDDDKLVPSVVSLSPRGDIIVGNAARQELIDHPDRTIYSVKRLMGRGIADVQEELKLFPFHIAEDSESVIRVRLGEKTFTPPGRISAFILRQLKKKRCWRARRAGNEGLSSRFPPTSMMRSGKPRAMPGGSPASKFFAS